MRQLKNENNSEKTLTTFRFQVWRLSKDKQNILAIALFFSFTCRLSARKSRWQGISDKTETNTRAGLEL